MAGAGRSPRDALARMLRCSLRLRGLLRDVRGVRMRDGTGERGVSGGAARSRMGRPRPSRGVAGESPLSSPDNRFRLLPMLLLRLMVLLLRRTGLLAVPLLLRSAAVMSAGSARQEDVLLAVCAPLRGLAGVSDLLPDGGARKLACRARGLLAAGVVIPGGTTASASEVDRSSGSIVWQAC